jgi:hypothetical protein
MMRKFSIVFFAIAIAVIINLVSHQCADSVNQSPNPVQVQVGKLNVSIDPRVELLSAIQSISNYPNIRRNNSYYNAVKTRFAPYAKMQAVSLTDELAKIGFLHDAPVEFMLYLSQPNECKPRLPYSDYLINRAQGKQYLNNYQKAIHEFSTKTAFNQFWRKNESFYNQLINLNVSELSDLDWISAMEKYYNDSHNSYNIIISPLLNEGYGPSIPTENGGRELYACLPVRWKDNDAVPALNKNDWKYYLWHEFSHSFVNPEIDKHPEVIEKTSMLFDPLQDNMSKKAYTNWTICVNEHIVRAINIRLTEIYLGQEEANRILNYELSNYFLYIEPVLEKLRKYEYLREREKITFSDFVPELLSVFDSISKTDNALTLSDLPFLGPINNVFQSDEIAIIYPTNCLNDESSGKTKKYVEYIHHRLLKRGLFIPDTVALKIDLSDYSLVVYGTIEENRFLKKYKSQFPFRIKDNAIITDQKYTEKDLKFITCLPNPQNKKLGMVIYTATDNKDILNINNVFHGPEDYILFVDREHVLKKGFYKKSIYDNFKFIFE